MVQNIHDSLRHRKHAKQSIQFCPIGVGEQRICLRKQKYRKGQIFSFSLKHRAVLNTVVEVTDGKDGKNPLEHTDKDRVRHHHQHGGIHTAGIGTVPVLGPKANGIRIGHQVVITG